MALDGVVRMVAEVYERPDPKVQAVPTENPVTWLHERRVDHALPKGQPFPMNERVERGTVRTMALLDWVAAFIITMRHMFLPEDRHWVRCAQQVVIGAAFGVMGGKKLMAYYGGQDG